MMKNQHLFVTFCALLLHFALLGATPADTTPKSVYAGNETRINSVEDAMALLVKATRIEENDPSRSEMLAREVRLFSLKSNNPLLRIRAQLQIASLLINSTRYAEALKLTLQVKELAENLQAEYELGWCYEIVGKIQLSSGDYGESLRNLYVSLNYFDKVNDDGGRGRILNTIGVDFFRLKDNEKAMSYYIRAAAISVLIRDTVLMGRVLNNMGGVLLERNDLRNALVKFNESLRLQMKFGMNLKLGITQMNLACLYRQLGQYDKSIELFGKAKSVFEHFDNYLNLAWCYINLSIFYESTDQEELWLNTLLKAYAIGDKYGFKGAVFEAMTGLQDYYEKHHNIDSAYHYSVMKAGIRESIDHEKTVSRLSVAELQYQFDKKEAEQSMKRQHLNIVMLAVVMTLVSLILVTVLIISRQRQKARLNILEKKSLTDELEFRNRELALQVMNLMKRNEFIINTSNRMKEINTAQPPGEIKEEVMKIAKSLQDQTDKEIWEEFELRFKQVHSGFYDRLLENFPELTPNELKMCGLLRLNLSTKEISELTGQRKEAIEMARFRLRKHLGLNDPQINLVTFLGKI